VGRDQGARRNGCWVASRGTVARMKTAHLIAGVLIAVSSAIVACGGQTTGGSAGGGTSSDASGSSTVGSSSGSSGAPSDGGSSGSSSGAPGTSSSGASSSGGGCKTEPGACVLCNGMWNCPGAIYESCPVGITMGGACRTFNPEAPADHNSCLLCDSGVATQWICVRTAEEWGQAISLGLSCL